MTSSSLERRAASRRKKSKDDTWWQVGRLSRASSCKPEAAARV
jgi:hypothetical protein